MNRLTIFLTFVLLAFTLNAWPAVHAPHANQASAPLVASAPTPIPINVSVTMGDRGSASSPFVVKPAVEESRLDRLLTYINDVLTPLFTLALVGVTWLLYRATSILADETKQLRAFAKQQSEDMATTIALSKQTAADSLATEDPRLNIGTIEFDESGLQCVFKVTNHGRTPSAVERYALVFTTDALPTDRSFVDGLETMAPPTDNRVLAIEGSVKLNHSVQLTSRQKLDVRDRNAILHVHGFFDYLDAARKVRRHGICRCFIYRDTSVRYGMFGTSPASRKLTGDWTDVPGVLNYDEPLLERDA